jgi:hypothetical protein
MTIATPFGAAGVQEQGILSFTYSGAAAPEVLASASSFPKRWAMP